MGERSGRSCCDQEPWLGAADRQLLGERRRVMVRRVVLAASVALCLAALTVSLLGGGQAALAHRLLWGSVACASGVTAGWVRQAMTAGRPGTRLVAAVVALAVGIGWQPLVPAIAAVAALIEHVLRPHVAPPAAPQPMPGGAIVTQQASRSRQNG